MKKFIVLAMVAASTASFAQNAFWSGELTNSDPIWNRPFEDGSGLSSIGTDNYYDVQAFWVTESGNYTYESAFANDGFIFVYTTFNAANPLSGYVAGSDDYDGAFSLLAGGATGLDGSKIGEGSGSGDLTLTANVQYYAVQTTFDIFTTGKYDNAIGGGPGKVNLGVVPEPASMVALGVGLLAVARRRRNK